MNLTFFGENHIWHYKEHFYLCFFTVFWRCFSLQTNLHCTLLLWQCANKENETGRKRHLGLRFLRCGFFARFSKFTVVGFNLLGLWKGENETIKCLRKFCCLWNSEKICHKLKSNNLFDDVARFGRKSCHMSWNGSAI